MVIKLDSREGLPRRDRKADRRTSRMRSPAARLWCYSGRCARRRQGPGALGVADRTNRDLSSVVRISVLREHAPAVVAEIAEAVGRLRRKDLHGRRRLDAEAAAEHVISS